MSLVVVAPATRTRVNSNGISKSHTRYCIATWAKRDDNMYVSVLPQSVLRALGDSSINTINTSIVLALNRSEGMHAGMSAAT